MSEIETRFLAPPAATGIRLDLTGAVTRRAGAIVPLLAVIVAWEAASRSGIVTPFLLPPISAVLGRVWEDAISGELARSRSATK